MLLCRCVSSLEKRDQEGKYEIERERERNRRKRDILATDRWAPIVFFIFFRYLDCHVRCHVNQNCLVWNEGGGVSLMVLIIEGY